MRKGSTWLAGEVVQAQGVHSLLVLTQLETAVLPRLCLVTGFVPCTAGFLH